ncbi:DUF1501 domain-containing protein [Paludisphaera borealis]|uniref:DUF1501 domain-containing protein n=1 Tax=Paludisphaera borealis TaxID=1387353 RepID=A0A1U7CWE9_9BACT|nr:DUF1501 domain-containing protein [Paludisphaera borealis]APW63251.1 hypothetical protein BSF38_04815 [Paludisphaera borealis]
MASPSEAFGCGDFRRQNVSRREALRAGALALTGLSLPQLYARGQGAGANGFGRARACILIFQWGGPSHLDTWDPKPDAPAGIRGEFSTIATSTPGLMISEHFPMLAARSHRLAVIRSMTHDDAAHLSTAHRVVTGHLAPRPNSDDAGPSPNDWPHLGALVAKVHPRSGAIPDSVTMPWTVAHPAAPGGKAPGQHGGWLGKVYDPFRIDGDPNAPDFRVPGLGLPDGVSLGRLDERRALLASSNDALDLPAWDSYQARALDALGSAEAQGAFRIDGEAPRIREMYGRNIHGQCLLMARRLVESGVRLVTVNWHNDGQNFWDTHGDNFNRLKNDLMPPADRGFSALLDDLHARGLLDETLVVWVGEFGRAPKITAANAGREHWPRCYSAALAGAGIGGGQIWGTSDRWGAYPARDPASPDDLGATILHSLGVDPASEIPDTFGRPMRINTGAALTSLFA